MLFITQFLIDEKLREFNQKSVLPSLWCSELMFRQTSTFEKFQIYLISYPELGFPHDFYENEMVKNFVYAGLVDQIEFK